MVLKIDYKKPEAFAVKNRPAQMIIFHEWFVVVVGFYLFIL